MKTLNKLKSLIFGENKSMYQDTTMYQNNPYYNSHNIISLIIDCIIILQKRKKRKNSNRLID